MNILKMYIDTTSTIHLPKISYLLVGTSLAVILDYGGFKTKVCKDINDKPKRKIILPSNIQLLLLQLRKNNNGLPNS
jgi:hypothetical protein